MRQGSQVPACRSLADDHWAPGCSVCQGVYRARRRGERARSRPRKVPLCGSSDPAHRSSRCVACGRAARRKAWHIGGFAEKRRRRRLSRPAEIAFDEDAKDRLRARIRSALVREARRRGEVYSAICGECGAPGRLVILDADPQPFFGLACADHRLELARALARAQLADGMEEEGVRVFGEAKAPAHVGYDRARAYDDAVRVALTLPVELREAIERRAAATPWDVTLSHASPLYRQRFTALVGKVEGPAKQEVKEGRTD